MPVSVEKVMWFVFYMDQGNRVAVIWTKGTMFPWFTPRPGVARSIYA